MFTSESSNAFPQSLEVPVESYNNLETVKKKKKKKKKKANAHYTCYGNSNNIFNTFSCSLNKLIKY